MLKKRVSKGNLQLGNHLVTLLQPGNCVRDEFIDNCLRGLLLVDHRGNLAHQERTGVVQGFIINVIAQVLEVMLDGDDALRGELLDLLLAVLFPVLDVGVVSDPKRTTL